MRGSSGSIDVHRCPAGWRRPGTAAEAAPSVTLAGLRAAGHAGAGEHQVQRRGVVGAVQPGGDGAGRRRGPPWRCGRWRRGRGTGRRSGLQPGGVAAGQRTAYAGRGVAGRQAGAQAAGGAGDEDAASGGGARSRRYGRRAVVVARWGRDGPRLVVPSRGSIGRAGCGRRGAAAMGAGPGGTRPPAGRRRRRRSMSRPFSLKKPPRTRQRLTSTRRKASNSAGRAGLGGSRMRPARPGR